MFNKVILVGNLTRDIEIRYANNGSAIGNTGIAASRRYTAASGEKKEEVCFVDITFFGKTAEIANQYLRKGSKILVEGRLKLDQWQDNNGQNRSKHSIVVETMQMLGSTQDSQGGQRPQTSRDNSSSYGTQQSGYQSGNYNQGYKQQPKNDTQTKSDKKGFDAEYSTDIPDVDINADMSNNGEDVLPF